jgi:hypothetical protein
VLKSLASRFKSSKRAAVQPPDEIAFSELVILHDESLAAAAVRIHDAPWTQKLGLATPPEDEARRRDLVRLAVDLGRYDILEQVSMCDPAASVREAAALSMPLSVA